VLFRVRADHDCGAPLSLLLDARLEVNVTTLKPEHTAKIVFKGGTRTDPNATLRGASVWFQTSDDDKDPDTGVNLSVQDQDAAEVASGSIPYGGFPDGYTSPLFPLPLIQEATYDAISNGVWSITVNPNGNDTWKFDAHLRLRFSDRTHIVATATNVTLSEDRRTTVIALANPT
jgi:hypothetical protein